MKPFRVSHSKVKMWLKCRYAYWLRYVEKLRKKVPARPLQFGRIVHSMIEADANGDDPLAVIAGLERTQGRMFRQQREEYGEILDDARVIMTEYFDYWKRDPLVYVRMKGKSAEFRFEVEVSKGILVEGVLDNVAKYKGHRALVEHKSGKAFPNDDHRWRDLQSAVYVRILKLLKLPPPDGILWDHIRSKPPSVPKLLKNKKPTRRPLDTLPLRVNDFIKREKLKPQDFKTLLSFAAKNRSAYFKRYFVPVKERVVSMLFDDFVDTAIEMSKLHGDPHAKQRTIGRHCDWCEFEPVCRAELQGLDAKFIRSKDYEVSQRPNDQEVDFEA